MIGIECRRGIFWEGFRDGKQGGDTGIEEGLRV